MIGVVLAGGISSRMKRDKALLPYPGNPKQTWLDRSIEILIDSGCSKVLVSGKKFGGIADSYSDKGPLSGIVTVAERHPNQSMLFIPVDMPLLDGRVLSELVQSAQPDKSVYFESSALPMIISMDQVQLEYMQRNLTSRNSDCSIRRLLKFLGAEAKVCSRPWALLNANTPEELVTLVNIQHSHSFIL